jgi:dipeptidyl aminopeptidase/acylaminoacyl peptidase
MRKMKLQPVLMIIALAGLAGAPARADDLEELVTRMAKVSGAWSPSLSPDGKRLALVSNLNGQPQVYTMNSDGSWPELLTDMNELIGAVSWSRDGQWLAVIAAPGGATNTQIYLMHPDGSDLHRITDGGKETNWLGHWTNDGRYVVISSNRRRPESMDNYLYDLKARTMRLVKENAEVGDLIDISRDGKRAVYYRQPYRGDEDLYLLDLASGKESLLTPHRPPGSNEFGYFSPDGNTIYLSSNAGREFVGLGRVKLDQHGKPGAIESIAARDNADLQEFLISPDGKLAVLNWNVEGKSELELFDLAARKVLRRIELPTEIVATLDISADGSRLAMMLFGSVAAPDIGVFDLAAGTLQQVTHAPHAGVDLAALVRPQLVHFKSFDGIELSAWLYRPRGKSGPLPTVIVLHGGPEEQERPTFLGTFQGMLKRGIAVFAPNVRGSSGFGKTFVNLDNGALRVNAVKDVKACVDYIVAQGLAEPRHIGIYGSSYGGYLTMAAMTEFPDLFAAGADLSGIVNFETFFANTEPWMAAISKVEYGDPQTQKELLRQLSPIHRVDRIKVPVLVIHGANDTNVPVGEAQQVVDSLKRRNVPVEYILFPDEGHGIGKEPNRISSSIATVRFFEKYLRPTATETRAGQ